MIKFGLGFDVALSCEGFEVYPARSLELALAGRTFKREVGLCECYQLFAEAGVKLVISPDFSRI